MNNTNNLANLETNVTNVKIARESLNYVLHFLERLNQAVDTKDQSEIHLQAYDVKNILSLAQLVDNSLNNSVNDLYADIEAMYDMDQE